MSAAVSGVSTPQSGRVARSTCNYNVYGVGREGESETLNKAKGKLSAAMGRKRLEKLLGRAPLFDFLVSVWHVDRMQADKPDAARHFKGLPKEAITRNLSSDYYIHKWLLESLVTAHFMSSPSIPRAGQRFRTLRLDHWDAVRQLVNLVHSIEDDESAVTLNDTDILLEMYRVVQRQFPWQRGFATAQMLYRSLRIYRTPETSERFQADNGISLDDFVKLGFLYWSTLRDFAFVNEDISYETFGVDVASRDRFLEHISDQPDIAAKYARQFRSRKFRMAHRPSRLRTHPMVCLENDHGKIVVAPLVDLVFLRVTQGLFFDFVKHDDLREIIADRFVSYCIELLHKGACAFRVRKEVRYRKSGNVVRSPDLFLADQGLVSAAIECKARRMSHQAQFGENPTEQARSGFAEIAKGMTQLWRYIADAEDGLLPREVTPNACTRLVLLTFDHWMETPIQIQPAVTAMANEIADEKGIAPQFRRPITFLTIQDLEHIVERGSVDQILSAFDGQLTETYEHWAISSIFDHLHGKLERKSIFTNEAILEVAPWFDLEKYRGG